MSLSQTEETCDNGRVGCSCWDVMVLPVFLIEPSHQTLGSDDAVIHTRVEAVRARMLTPARFNILCK